MSLLACSLAALVLSGSGEGTRYMETVLQDDAQFLHRTPAQVERSARRAAELGTDRIRLTASWSTIAPAPRAKTMPGAPFDPRASSTYPDGSWTNLDKAVRAVFDAGMDAQIDLAFWAPRWAVRRASANPTRNRRAPDVKAFAEFANAVARRYNGEYPDRMREGKTLPAVRLWTTWNEPNHPSFLEPQWKQEANGSWRPASPHIYRAMHNAAYDAVKGVSGENRVLMGGTASIGSTVPGKGGVAPLKFLRALACVDDALAPLQVPECAGYKPLQADGWSHHPYSRYVTPGTSTANADDVPIADVARLSTLLEDLRKKGRIAAKLPLYQTEYGYETKQDDPFNAPFTREQQAAFIGWSTYLAWKDPETRMHAQFLLNDIDPRESGKKMGTRSYYRDWQSGLYDANDQPKPAAQAFKLPFWAQTEGEADRKAVLLFGEVKPGTGQSVVRIEQQDTVTGDWSAISTYGPACDEKNSSFLTDHGGFFLRAAPAVGAVTYRFSWERPDGSWESSVAIPVAAEASQPPPV